MPSWTLFESFDPVSGRLFLDVVDASAPPPARPGLATSPLETFRDFPEARAFVDGYVRALDRGHEKPVREVFCGEHQHPGCDVGNCKLGVTREYRCEYRDRPK